MASKLSKLDNLSKWMNKYRPWINSKLFDSDNLPLKKSELNFTLMSYNVLSEDYLKNYKAELYPHCPQAVLSWPERGERVLKEIELNNPDIICLQEVYLDHYHQLYKPELRKQGYDSIFSLREFRFDGCALFYKKNKFNLLKTREVNLHREDLTKILDKPNVGLIAMFEPIENAKNKIDNRLVVCTTHILFFPTRGETKLAQVRLLLAEIERISLRQKNGSKSYHPFLIAGDFNLLPGSPIHRFIEQGVLHWQGLDCHDLSGHFKRRQKSITEERINIKSISSDTIFTESATSQPETDQIVKHNLNLRSVFGSRNNHNRNLVTTLHEKACEMVDYIFYHQTEELNLIGFRKLLSENIRRKIPYLPNELMGSDHFSIIAKFSLLNRKN